MSDKELIEKIEDAYRRVHKIGPDAIYETELREVLRAAADALEVRQPSEDDREVLAKQLRDIGAVRKVDQDCSCQDCEGAAEWVNAPLSVVLDRLTVRKAAPAEAFCIEHGNFHAVELGDPTCEFEDGFGEPVDGEQP